MVLYKTIQLRIIRDARTVKQSLSEHDLYELVSDFGVFICTALRRDHYLAHMIDRPETWLDLADRIGQERAKLLKEFPEQATDLEFNKLIEKQIRDALDEQNPEITPTIWLCESDNGQITMIEGWGEDLTVYLHFRVVGHYDSREDAFDDLNRLYFTTLAES